MVILFDILKFRQQWAVYCTHTCRTLDKKILPQTYLSRHPFTPNTHIREFIKLSCLSAESCSNKISPQTELAQVRRESLLSALSHLHNVCVFSSRWKCKMKHNYVVLQLTTDLSPGALETRLCIAWRKRVGREKRTCVGPAHLSDSDKATYLEVAKIKNRIK